MADENHQEDRKGATASHAAQSPCPVVGIGASAGGLEALTTFFKAMPADSGFGFVVVQHLDPERESHMAELLARHTAMPVRQIEEGARVEPNHVYFIRPNAELTIDEGVMHLAEPSARRGARRPIDLFFTALAEDRQERAIGIILSGTGNDGTAGIRALKEQGGCTIAQEPETAGQPGMPQSAIGSGMIDVVLPPDQMPDALLRQLRHLDDVVNGPDPSDKDGQRAMDGILTFLRGRSGHDFRCYKSGTLTRRIQRRMSITNSPELSRYEQFLRRNPKEVEALTKDLMISVTGFFRDPQAWQELEREVIAPLVRDREPDDAIRVWVPGCATGEEAYTVAILLAEQAAAAEKPLDVKIFATDTGHDNLNLARHGLFPATIERDVAPERLSRFFAAVDDGYQITQDLRDWVIFAPQNLLQDPPFFQLDLITCRNLLIYLGEEAQARVLALLHFALREGGHLFLGSAETVSHHAALFETVSKKWRVYRRLGPTRHDIVNFPVTGRREKREQQVAAPAPERQRETDRPSAVAQRRLAERYAPPSVLIDRAHQILYFHGETERHLAQPPGEPTRDLLAMARHGLRTRLRGAVRSAFEQNRAVSFSAWVKQSEATQQVAVTVEPLRGATTEGLLLVSFAEPAEPTVAERSLETPSLDEAAREREFETELEQARDELRRTIEQLETSNEELRASNEEITSMNEEFQSTNEEFQSTNEELETSKEELQSLNEELNTVNSQLQRKLEELEQTTNDLDNLLTSTDLAAIFLDREFRIRWFSQAMTRLVDVVRSDVGRPISHFATRYIDQDLSRDAGQVLQRLVPVEAEVESDDGRWYLRRVLPYRTHDDRIDGVVVTFVDITATKQAEQVLRAAYEHMQKIFDTVRQPLLVLDSQLRVKSANASFYEAFGVRSGDTEGVLIYDLGNRQWDMPQLRHLLSEILPDNQVFDDYEVEHQFEAIGRRTMLLNARRLDDVQLILLAIEDITERKRWDEHQKILLAELSHRVKNTLATVQSIAAQTVRSAPSLKDFQGSFNGRLQALGRTHSLITRGNWETAALREIIEQTLQPYDPTGERLRIDGDALELKPRAAIALSQVLNELATNAAKHGALSAPGGRIAIAWEIVRDDHGPALRLHWREAGGPKTEPPAKTGFGMNLLERMTTYELDGAVRTEFPPEGFRCEIKIPQTPENFQA